MTAPGARLGFACNWDADAPATWSGTPWNLRAALRVRTEVVDVELGVPAVAKAALRAVSARPAGGAWRSPWRHTAAFQAMSTRSLEANSRDRCDVLLEIGDLGVVRRPFFVYQDLSIDAVIDSFDEEAGAAPHFPAMSASFLRRRRDRQRRVYEAAAGVLVMSDWLRRSLIGTSGLDPDRVHVVPPGVPADVTASRSEHRVGRDRRKLLFVGRDFHTKGGPAVLAAFEALRRELGPQLELTVAGPPVWPGAGPVPAGVSFLGAVDRSTVLDLYDRHDLFVMPSVFEGFGIVFAEALSRGLPCVGRDAFAMPEIVTDGVDGAIVDDLSPDALAERIGEVLADDDIYRRAAAGAEDVRSRYDWGRAAGDVLAVTGVADPASSRS